MNWSIGLALLNSVVFSTQIVFGAEQVATPWENTKMAESFIASFLRVISRSSAFSSSQLGNMSTIRKTLTDAMEMFNNSNMSSKTKIQTLNMVFASALAEITATEYGGISIESKTKEIENALSLAFQETIGLSNPQFVGDIKNLIFSLAHTKATGVSPASVVKVGDYKQGSLGQLETSTSAKAVSVSSSATQRGPGIEQQVQSAVEPPIDLNSTGGYRPQLVSVTKPLGQQFQTPTEQYAKVSKQAALSIKNPQGISGIGTQRSYPQVTSIQAQQVLNGYGTGVAMEVATGEGLGPTVQSSGVDELWQQSSIGKMGQEPSSQGKSEAVVQGPSSNELPTPISYGEGSVPVGLQGSPGIGLKSFSTQDASKAVRQGPGVYETRAQASSAVGEKETIRGSIDPLREESSAYSEQEQETQGTSVAVGPRPEAHESGNYGSGTSALISKGVASFKQPAITIGLKQRQETTGKGTETLSSSGPRAAATVVTGSYVPVTGTGKVHQEAQDVQGSSRAGNQYERGIREQILVGQRPANQGQYGTRYQGIGQYGGQGIRNYPPGTDATTEAALGVTGRQAPSGQGSSEVGGQGLNSARVSEVGSRSVTYALNKDGRGSAAAVATAASDSQSSSDDKGLISNEPASEGHNVYESESSTAITGYAEGNGEGGSLIASPISTPGGSSIVSSPASSLENSKPTKTSAFSNAVSSIVSKVGTVNPGMSDCNVLIQTMLEIIADLVHLLGYCT